MEGKNEAAEDHSSSGDFQLGKIIRQETSTVLLRNTVTYQPLLGMKVFWWQECGQQKEKHEEACYIICKNPQEAGLHRPITLRDARPHLHHSPSAHSCAGKIMRVFSPLFFSLLSEPGGSRVAPQCTPSPGGSLGRTQTQLHLPSTLPSKCHFLPSLGWEPGTEGSSQKLG